MKKGVKVVLIIVLVITVPLLGVLGYKLITEKLSRFDNEGRYDDTILNNMSEIYETQSDIYAWNEGYSSSDDCPWGFKHEGLDFFFNNDSAVLAAAPGKVISIEYRDNGPLYENRLWVTVTIQFNKSVEISYNFESWTNESSLWEKQQSMITVQKGDWVEKGQEFGRFLAVEPGAHIDFSVREGDYHFCPKKYLSLNAYNEILSLIHVYHPNWGLCYPIIWGSFDNAGRYDDSILNNMSVIYDSQSDIVAWNEGFSSSTVCPWGFVHEGLDFFYINNSAVLAAAPGEVISIEYRDMGEGLFNRYWVTVWILFNKTVGIGYNFEAFTDVSSDWENQQSMISVMTGDWVEQGQEIGRFLAVGAAAHVHFDVIEDNQKFCPQKYLSTAAYNELISLVHSFHPTWDLCYP